MPIDGRFRYMPVNPQVVGAWNQEVYVIAQRVLGP